MTIGALDFQTSWKLFFCAGFRSSCRAYVVFKGRNSKIWYLTVSAEIGLR